MDAETVRSVSVANAFVGELLERMPREYRDRSLYFTVQAHRITARRGDVVRFVDILCSGRLRVLNEFANGSVYSFAALEPVAYIGSYEVIAKKRDYCATVEAVEACSFIRMARDDFHRWFLEDQWITVETSFRMASDICDQSSHKGEVLFYPSLYVVGDFLLRSYTSGRRESLRLSLSRQEIADGLGLSIRTINRCVKELKESGLLTIDRGKIRIDGTHEDALRRRLEELKEGV